MEYSEWHVTQVHDLVCLHLQVLHLQQMSVMHNVNYKGYEPALKCTIESLSVCTAPIKCYFQN